MIRKMVVDDIPNVLKIEESSFKYPWNLSFFKSEFSKAHSIQLVYLKNDTIIGYIVAWNILGEVEIGTIATKKSERSTGVASKLLSYLFKLTNPTSCFLEVSNKNHTAIKFYQKQNFLKIDTRKMYYQDGSDAIIMKLTF